MASTSFSIPDIRFTYTTSTSPWSTPFAEIGKISLGDLTPKASASNGTIAATSKPTTDSIIADIRQVAKEHGVKLDGIKSAVDVAENERKRRIENALKGTVDLEIMKGAKGRRFIAAYWWGDVARFAQGVEYPVERDEDNNPIGYNVFVNDSDHPFSARHATMDKFREALGTYGPYHIAYFDH